MPTQSRFAVVIALLSVALFSIAYPDPVAAQEGAEGTATPTVTSSEAEPPTTDTESEAATDPGEENGDGAEENEESIFEEAAAESAPLGIHCVYKWERNNAKKFPACPDDPEEAGEASEAQETAESSPVVNLGDRLVFRVGALDAWLAEKKAKPRDLRLYLDGVEITDLPPEAVPEVPESGGVHAVRFRLSRSDENRDDWRGLLGPFDFDPRRMNVGLGLTANRMIDGSSEHDIRLQAFRPLWGTVWALLVVALVVSLWTFPSLRSALRDRHAKTKAGEIKPYSLALVQMATWFFLILAAYGFLWLALGDLDTITPSLLALMGIGAGTALGSSAIDSQKKAEEVAANRQARRADARLEEARRDAARTRDPGDPGSGPPTPEEVRRMADLQRAHQRQAKTEGSVKQGASVGFFNDILSNGNSISFHRIQMLVWTVVLGIIFVVNVWQHLAMPEFSDTLLGLLGISAGTYVGFKLPERFEEPPEPNT